MSAPSASFSLTYAEARAKFLAATAVAGLSAQSHPHPLGGHDGEALAMDVVRAGPAEAAAVLVLSSGCHGIEGYCGSGVQTALLGDTAFLRAAREADVALLFVHALNPHGFSWWRRTTHENVDLNRNFQDFTRPLPENPGYDAIADWLVPEEWPPTPAVRAAIERWAAGHGGFDGLQQVVSSGQYRHPRGLFYGGQAPTWSHRTLRAVLREHALRCSRLGWIDVHTGLGPSGVGERIFACRDDAASLARAQAWWGDAVTSIYDGSSTSAMLTGLMWTVADDECRQAEYTGIALEYGTVPMMEVIDALRADQWMHNHPQRADAATRRAIRARVREAFHTDTPAWKAAVIEQAFEAAQQALRGLGTQVRN